MNFLTLIQLLIFFTSLILFISIYLYAYFRFKAVAYMGEEELSTAWDKTKKDARRQAAELAVRGLVANGGFGKFSSLATSV